MKTKDFKNLRAKSIKELRALISQKLSGMEKKKLEIMAGKEKNIKSAGNLRREVAQIKTLVKEKEILEKLTAKNEEIKTK